jgi:hypothetical protein
MRPGDNPGAWFRVSPDDVVERTVSPVVDPIPPPVVARDPSDNQGKGSSG